MLAEVLDIWFDRLLFYTFNFVWVRIFLLNNLFCINVCKILWTFFRVANHKLLECEVVCLQLAFLQLAALKTLATLLSCGRYSELLLVPNAVPQKSSDGIDKDKVTFWGIDLCCLNTYWSNEHSSPFQNVSFI